MRRADVASSFTIFVFGVIAVLFIIPNQIPGHAGEGYALQAADFPRTIALIFTLLAGVYCLVRALGSDGEAHANTPVPLSSWTYLGFAAVLLILAVVFLTYAGFLIGGAFIVASFMFVMGERRPAPLIALCIGAPLAVWGFFWKFLHFPLP